MEMTNEEFEKVVVEALKSLPEEFVVQLENVAITVKEKPDVMDLENIKKEHENILLFGLYKGVPKTKRGSYYSSLPDKIVIFKEPILLVSSSIEDAKKRIRDTVLHEIGHHFGMSEKDLEKAGK